MKILIPIMSFSKSGGSRVLSNLATNWIRQGNNVDFLVFNKESDPYHPTKAGIIKFDKWGNTASIKGNSNSIMPKKNGVVKIIGMFNAINKIGSNYDIILANHSLTAWPVRFSNCGNAKKFYYIQAYEPDYFKSETGIKNHILLFFSILSYSLNMEQICNSPIYFKNKRIRAKEWVPPGIDFSNFYPEKSKMDRESFYIGCIGRREIVKGTQFVLDSFESLSKSVEKVKLQVAYGNLPDKWTHPSCNIVIPSNDIELGDFYRSLDILIAPGTVQHGAPHYPVMEAMACGIPVVTTGYLPANENNAWLVQNKSSGSITDAIIKIMSDREEVDKKVKQALLDIKDFSWENVSEKMLYLFRNALNG